MIRNLNNYIFQGLRHLMRPIKQYEFGALFGLSKRQTSQYMTGSAPISFSKIIDIAEQCNTVFEIEKEFNDNEVVIKITITQNNFL